MIKQIENLPENIVGFIYKGKVTGNDYENVIFPSLEKAAETKKPIRIIFQFNNSFKKISLKAIMDDILAEFKYLKKIGRIAMVSDNKKINHIIKAFSFLFSGNIKIFSLSESNKAIGWISKK